MVGGRKQGRVTRDERQAGNIRSNSKKFEVVGGERAHGHVARGERSCVSCGRLIDRPASGAMIVGAVPLAGRP